MIAACSHASAWLTQSTLPAQRVSPHVTQVTRRSPGVDSVTQHDLRWAPTPANKLVDDGCSHREDHALVDVSRETLGYSPGRAGVCGCENLRRIPAATRGHANAPTAHRIDAHETIRGVIYASSA